MCFTAIISNTSLIGQGGLDALRQMIHCHQHHNRDGYALRATDYLGNELRIRTLDFKRFTRFIDGNSDRIGRSSLLHLRHATSRVCDEFVHLWEFGG